MKNIKKIYNIIADTIIALLLSIIMVVALYVFIAPFSEVASIGMTNIKTLYFFYLTEHVVASLILTIGVTIFITPRICKRLLNE